jgi:hypothetical protein
MIDLYVCSKPLQYFNIKNIGSVKYESSYKILAFVGNFNDADKFVSNVRKYDAFWNQVIFLHNRKEREEYIKSKKINNLFVENDSSWRMLKIVLRGNVRRLYVFEEGIGTYKDVYYPILMKFLRKMAGIGNHYGAAWFCKNVFLYEPDFFNKRFHSNRGIPFKYTFIEGLEKNQQLLSHLSESLPKALYVSNKRILIYLTNYDINADIIRKMESIKGEYDLLIVKPHPHIKNPKVKSKDVVVLYTNMMIEIVLFDLVKRNNKIEVWHYASTSVVHFLKYIKQVNLSTSIPIFDEYVNYVSTIK